MTNERIVIEIKGLKLPKSVEATRICREDLNEVIATFVQDKAVVERGVFDPDVVPEELTQLKMGKIIREKYPELSEHDQEAVRQQAVAAMTLTQQAKAVLTSDGEGEIKANTAFIEGVRRFALSVTELDIDLIDRVNPFEATIAVLAKSMDAKTLLQVQAVINAKKDKLTYEEARALAERAASSSIRPKTRRAARSTRAKTCMKKGLRLLRQMKPRLPRFLLTSQRTIRPKSAPPRLRLLDRSTTKRAVPGITNPTVGNPLAIRKRFPSTHPLSLHRLLQKRSATCRWMSLRASGGCSPRRRSRTASRPVRISIPAGPLG